MKLRRTDFTIFSKLIEVLNLNENGCIRALVSNSSQIRCKSCSSRIIVKLQSLQRWYRIPLTIKGIYKMAMVESNNLNKMVIKKCNLIQAVVADEELTPVGRLHTTTSTSLLLLNRVSRLNRPFLEILSNKWIRVNR